MARIRIDDLPRDAVVSREDMRKMAGGSVWFVVKWPSSGSSGSGGINIGQGEVQECDFSPSHRSVPDYLKVSLQVPLGESHPPVSNSLKIRRRTT